jgi:4-amino-4-deoxy-L-arabinose transferase-like glycosyltransferase
MQVTKLEHIETTVSNSQKSEWFKTGSSQRLLAVMVGVAFAIRAVVVVFSFRSVASPQEDFAQFSAEMGWVARSIALGHGFSSPFFPITGPTALVPPLFPYLLAGVFRILGLYTARSAVAILLFDSVLSALTCIPIYLCLRDAVGERQARLGAWIWAAYPFAVYYSAAQVWDYSLTSLLFAWCFYFAERLPRRRNLAAWLGFGALYGVTALSNPSVVSLLPVLLALALYRSWRTDGRWLARGLVVSAAFFLTIAPWSLRNYRQLHTAVPIRDGFWLEFWAGNHGDTFVTNPGDSHPASNWAEMAKYKQQGEVAYLDGKRVLATDYVTHHPVAFLAVTARRVVRYWTGFWSFSRAYLAFQPLDFPNLFFCSTVTILMLRGMRRWWREDRAAALPYVLVLAVFPIPYYFSHASMDYRQPIEPEIIVLATLGCMVEARETSEERAAEFVGAHDEIVAGA